MTELIVVGVLIAGAAGYLCRIYIVRKKSACAKCALMNAVDRKRP